MSLSTLSVRRVRFKHSGSRRWVKNQTARKARRLWKAQRHEVQRAIRGWVA